MIYKYFIYFTYVKRSYIALTGISNFQVKSNIHEDHYSNIETLITKGDKQRLLNKYNFKPFPIKWNGNIDADLIPKNGSDFLYFLDDKNKGLYGYVLYFISKKDNTLIVYHNFSD